METGVLWFSLGAPFAMILFHVVLHRTIFEEHEPNHRLTILLRIIASVTTTWTFVAVALFIRAPLAKAALNVFYVLFVSLGLGFCYFIVFTMSETARRIRILVDAYVAEKTEYEAVAYGRKAREEYSPRMMIDVRIDRLVAMGAVKVVGGKIQAVNGPMLFASKFIRLWRGVVFDSSQDARTSEDWKRVS